MSGIERRYQKDVDEIILRASKKDLKIIQEIDLKNQLSGSSFYELFSIHYDGNKKLTSQANYGRKKNN